MVYLIFLECSKCSAIILMYQVVSATSDKVKNHCSIALSHDHKHIDLSKWMHSSNTCMSYTMHIYGCLPSCASISWGGFIILPVIMITHIILTLWCRHRMNVCAVSLNSCSSSKQSPRSDSWHLCCTQGITLHEFNNFILDVGSTSTLLPWAHLYFILYNL